MGCPSCGSSQRRPIAAGHWECTGLVVVAVDPVYRTPIEEPCRTRYNEGPADMSLGLCYCGTSAIGVCSRCSAPVDGDHSRLVGGFRVCGTCLAKERRAREASDRKVAEAVAADKRAKANALRDRLRKDLPLLVPRAKDALHARGAPTYRMARWDWTHNRSHILEWLGDWWAVERGLAMSTTGAMAFGDFVFIYKIQIRWPLPGKTCLMPAPAAVVDLTRDLGAADEYELQRFAHLEETLRGVIAGSVTPIKPKKL
jgi:hypothetical protein